MNSIIGNLQLPSFTELASFKDKPSKEKPKKVDEAKPTEKDATSYSQNRSTTNKKRGRNLIYVKSATSKMCQKMQSLDKGYGSLKGAKDANKPSKPSKDPASTPPKVSPTKKLKSQESVNLPPGNLLSSDILLLTLSIFQIPSKMINLS